MALYHVSLGLPARRDYPQGVYRLCYTNHAEYAAESDRFGPLPLLPHLNVETASLIEVEIGETNQIKKLVYRTRLDNRVDICYAVIPAQRSFVVKTVWGQDRYDCHRTLKKEKYSHVS